MTDLVPCASAPWLTNEESPLVGHFIKNWPFLTVGLSTFALFVGLEAVGDAGCSKGVARTLCVDPLVARSP